MRPPSVSALLLVAALLIGGCSVFGSSSREQDALDEARARWDASGPSAYSMTYGRLCFCPTEVTGPFAVRVVGDRVVEVTLDGTPVVYDRAMTVDALFERLASAYARDAHRVDVTYDSALGFPSSIFIDYDERIADEEMGYTVTDLRAE